MVETSPSPRSGALLRAGRILWRARDRLSLTWLAAAMAAVTAAGLAASLAPIALARLIDGLTDAGGAGAGAGTVVAPTAAYLGALLLQRLLEQVQAYAYGRGEQRLTRRLAANGFEHMLRLPMRFHSGARSGALSQTLADGAFGLRLILLHLVMTVSPVVVQLGVAGVIVASVFNPATGLWLVGAMALYAAVFAWGVRRQAAPAKAISAAQVEAGGVTADGLMNIEAIKSFTAERRFAARYDAALAGREAQWRRFLGFRLTNGLTVAVVFVATLGGVLWLGVAGLSRGEITLGEFVLLNTYVLQLVRPLELMGFAARDVGQGLAYLDKFLAVLAEPVEPMGEGAGAPLAAGPAELAFEDVVFGFEPGRRTLDGVSFRVRPGAVLGVVGASGAGKSSILKLILRLYAPDAGRVLLDGRPLSDIPLRELRGQIAVVSQDTILFNDTIAENLRLGEASADAERLDAAVGAARLTDLLDALPLGLETQVGERGLKLSGGEKQRVAIARAALKDARLVLLDEATAALDPGTEREIWRTLTEVSGGATTIIVTHRLATVVQADEILVLDRGRIVERGAHDLLLGKGGAYAALWRAQHEQPAA